MEPYLAWIVAGFVLVMGGRAVSVMTGTPTLLRDAAGDAEAPPARDWC